MSAAVEHLAELDRRVDNGEQVDSGLYVTARIEAELETRQAQAADRRRAEAEAAAAKARRETAIRAARWEFWAGLEQLRQHVDAVIEKYETRSDDRPLACRPLDLRTCFHDCEAQHVRFVHALETRGNHTVGRPIGNVRDALAGLAENIRVWTTSGAVTEQDHHEIEAEIADLISILAPVLEFDR